MLDSTTAFSGFSVPDIDAARTFYRDTLGLDVTDDEMGFLEVRVGGGNGIMIYPSDSNRPATYTMLNFPVDDIEAAVDWLAGRGVMFQRYDGFEQDERGIARGMGPAIAWFHDPAGNVLSVMSGN